MFNNYLLFIQLSWVINRTYCPIVLTCEMHTDYTVSHDKLIFETYSVVLVKCTDNNQQLDGFFS